MKAAKGTITRLKNQIESTVIPDPVEFGYEGLSKDMLIDCLDETYGLLEGLLDKKETFDVIYMKRNLTLRAKDCSEYLKDNFKELNKEKKFNRFLGDIFAIRTIVKETYLLVVQGALRDEAQLHLAKEQLEDYKTELSSYLEYRDAIDESYQAIESVKSSLKTFSDDYQNSSEHVLEVVSSVDSAGSEVLRTKDDVESAKEEILLTKAQIRRNKVAYQGSVKRFEELIVALESQDAKIQVQLESVEQISSKIAEQQTGIQNIIDDANRASMAGSFLKRKNELDKPIKWSGRIMNCALLLTAGASFVLLIQSGILSNQFDYISFLTKLPVLAPLVWIAWSNSQRNNYLVKIQEDYAFKYASAMAFEGYKKQVQETDEALELRLLELAIENMGANPIRLFDKPVKASPMNDVIQGAKETIETLKTVKDN